MTEFQEKELEDLMEKLVDVLKGKSEVLCGTILSALLVDLFIFDYRREPNSNTRMFLKELGEKMLSDFDKEIDADKLKMN